MLALPGGPLLVLRRVQIDDAARLLHDISTGNITPDLIYLQAGGMGPRHLKYQVRPRIPRSTFVERSAILQRPEEDRSAQLRAHQS